KASVLIHRRQGVVISHENGRAVMGRIGRTRTGHMSAVVEGPNLLQRKVRRLPDVYGLLGYIEEGRPLNEPVQHLIVAGTGFARSGVRRLRRERIQRRDRSRGRQYHKGIHERSRMWTGCLLRGYAQVV